MFEETREEIDRMLKEIEKIESKWLSLDRVQIPDQILIDTSHD